MGWHLSDQTEHRNRPKFDFTITFGDVAMLIGFLVAIFTAWTNIDKRVVVLEEKATYQKFIDTKQDEATSQQLGLIRQGQTRIEAKLDRVIEHENK